MLASPKKVAQSLLPSKDDDTAIRKNFAVLMSRILVENLSFFNTLFKDVIINHIPHQYEKEMSRKSEVV